MRTFSFEKLVGGWQKARKLSIVIYKQIKNYPTDKRFFLISQMRRSALSMSSNIAEGTGGHSAKDKARFTEIAYSCVLEQLNQIILSNDLNFIKDNLFKQIRQSISEFTAMLDGLYKSHTRNINLL